MSPLTEAVKLAEAAALAAVLVTALLLLAAYLVEWWQVLADKRKESKKRANRN